MKENLIIRENYEDRCEESESVVDVIRLNMTIDKKTETYYIYGNNSFYYDEKTGMIVVIDLDNGTKVAMLKKSLINYIEKEKTTMR